MNNKKNENSRYIRRSEVLHGTQNVIAAEATIHCASQFINPATLKEEDEICFIKAQNCCVCFVDIVNSTRITSSINNPEKVRKYYEIFLNTMATIANNSGAKIIKNVRDCLILDPLRN